MMLTDFAVICIGQEEPGFPESFGEVKDDPERETKVCVCADGTPFLEFECYKRRQGDESIYDDWYNFKTADSLTGVLYFVWQPHDKLLEDSFFDFAGEAGSKHVCIVPKWEKTVRELLEYYTGQSPEHRIAVLLRMQDRSDDTVHKACSVDEFMKLLKSGGVVWNETYFIKAEG